MNTIVSDNKYWYILSIICTILLCIIMFSHNFILYSIVILISLFFLASPIYLLPTLFASFLLPGFLEVNSDISMQRILSIIFVIECIIYIVRNNGIINTKLLIAIIFLTLIMLIDGIIYNFNSTDIFQMSFYLLICISAASIYNPSTNYKKLSESFLLSLIISSVFLIIFIFLHNSINIAGRIVIDNDININSVAAGMAIYTSVFLISIFLNYKIIYKIVSILLFSILIYLMFLIGSRSALFGITLATIVTFIYILFSKKTKKINKIIIISFIIIVTIIIVYLFNVPFSTLITRYKISTIIESGGTGRIDIWNVLIFELIPKHLLIGVGVSNEISFVYDQLSVNNGSHNMLLAIISEYGIIGLTLYIYIIIYSIYISYCSVKNNKNISNLFYTLLIALICCVGNGIGENIINLRHFWLILGILFFLGNDLRTSNNTSMLYEY